MPKAFEVSLPGRSPVSPVSNSKYARFLSRTADSRFSIDSLTLSSLSGLGKRRCWSIASCSIVRSMFRSFSNTNQSWCKSWFDLIRSSGNVQDLPCLTSFSPQFFLSSKNSKRILLTGCSSGLGGWELQLLA